MTTSTQVQSSNASSTSLLSRFVLERDESAFAELVRRHDRIVWGVCVRVLRNQCDAEDAFQQTFVLLARKADRIRKPGSLSSWLHGVAFRTATRIRNQRRHSVSEDMAAISQGKEPYEELARRHQIEQVDQQLHLLHEKYRTPLVLFYYQNRTATQIATELSLTVAAVEGRLRRGRQQLKRGLLGKGCDLSILLPLMAASPTASLLTSTSGYALAAGTGLIPTGLLNPYRMGVITMLRKSLLLALVVGLAGFAAALHARPTNLAQRQLDTTAPAEPATEVAAAAIAVAGPSDDESRTPQEAIHDHFRQIHAHVYKLFLSLHGA